MILRQTASMPFFCIIFFAFVVAFFLSVSTLKPIAFISVLSKLFNISIFFVNSKERLPSISSFFILPFCLVLGTKSLTAAAIKRYGVFLISFGASFSFIFGLLITPFLATSRVFAVISNISFELSTFIRYISFGKSSSFLVATRHTSHPFKYSALQRAEAIFPLEKFEIYLTSSILSIVPPPVTTTLLFSQNSSCKSSLAL